MQRRPDLDRHAAGRPPGRVRLSPPDQPPPLDALAREGILFEQCINTGGGTLPVHASLFTSVPPDTHGVWPDSGRVLDERYVTLADRAIQRRLPLASAAALPSPVLTDAEAAQLRTLGYLR